MALAAEDHIEMNYCVYFGVMSLLNAIFDIRALVTGEEMQLLWDVWQKILRTWTRFLCPVFELAATLLCHCIIRGMIKPGSFQSQGQPPLSRSGHAAASASPLNSEEQRVTEEATRSPPRAPDTYGALDESEALPFQGKSHCLSEANNCPQ